MDLVLVPLVLEPGSGTVVVNQQEAGQHREHECSVPQSVPWPSGCPAGAPRETKALVAHRCNSSSRVADSLWIAGTGTARCCPGLRLSSCSRSLLDAPRGGAYN